MHCDRGPVLDEAFLTPDHAPPRRTGTASRSVEGVPQIELSPARGVVDAGDALVLGWKTLALARVVGGAPVARGRRVERQVVRPPRTRRAVRARAVRHPGVEDDHV